MTAPLNMKTLILLLSPLAMVSCDDRPMYPHSGFTPDCPTWELPDKQMLVYDIYGVQPPACDL